MLKILLVDDDQDDAELLQSAFKKVDPEVNVLIADDCKEMWQQFKDARPDILFLDINLPGINGMECLKLIRAHEHYHSIRIIMYSTSGNKATIQESFRNQANFYIIKPDTMEGIENVVRKVLQLDWNEGSRGALINFVI